MKKQCFSEKVCKLRFSAFCPRYFVNLHFVLRWLNYTRSYSKAAFPETGIALE
jgi:hypothetical protein